MTKDPIVEEVRKVRKQIEDECGNDWDRLFAHFREIQKKWPGKVVGSPRKRKSNRPTGNTKT
jgi:hypothetical protein